MESTHIYKHGVDVICKTVSLEGRQIRTKIISCNKKYTIEQCDVSYLQDFQRDEGLTYVEQLARLDFFPYCRLCGHRHNLQW